MKRVSMYSLPSLRSKIIFQILDDKKLKRGYL